MYSVVDIESNGAGFRKESIIEIAIYRFDGRQITDQFISMVNPEADITPFVQKLTGISPKMVKTAPKFHEIAKRIVEITEGTTLVGHNIDFDYRMMRQSFARLGYDYKINTLDTIPLAQKLIPDAASYSLGKLVKSLGIPLTEQHRAAGDARATLDLFKLLMAKDKDKSIIQAQYDISNAKTYINKIKELTQDLPAGKGIVYFQDASGKIIYSSYTDDIFRTAKLIFNSKSKRWKALQNDTEQIHYEFAGTDIIAKLILRNRNIHKKTSLPFGLIFKKNEFWIEKKPTENELKPILWFKNFSQGKKALHYINSIPQLYDFEYLNSFLSLKEKTVLLVSSGRNLGEKSFLYINNGNLEGYGFYELHTQIQTLSKIKKLMISANANSEIINDIKLGLLKNDFEILPVPEN